MVKYIQTLPIEERERLVNDVFEYFTERKRFNIHIDFKNSTKSGKKSKEIDKIEIIPDLNYSCTLIENDVKTNNIKSLQKHILVINNIEFNDELFLFHFMSIINNNTNPQIIKILIDKSDNLDKTNSKGETLKDIINGNSNINQILKNKIIEYVNFKREFDQNLDELNKSKIELQQTHWIHVKRRSKLEEKIQMYEITLRRINEDLNKILLNQENNVHL